MADFKRRLNGLQAVMEEQELDLVVFGASPDYQYLTGTDVEWRRGRDLQNSADCVFVAKEGDPVILASASNARKVEDSWIDDVRTLGMFEEYTTAVKDIIGDICESPKRVAIGEYTWGNMTLTLASLCRGARFRSGEGLLDKLRMIKEPEEIEKLRNVAVLTDRVMERIIDQVEGGATMRDMGLKIETMGRMVGASDVSFPSTAGFCKSGSEPDDRVFNYEREEPLMLDSSIAYDVGFVMDGYCSDWGRSFYFGEADEHIRKAYEVLQSAVVETIDRIGEDVNAVNDLFPSIESVCDREGYGDYLRARLSTGMVGHQIGVEVHEDPWLKPSETQELLDGMVFCVEPKLWHKGEYYLRVEDMVLIKNGKGEFLTNYDRERFLL